MKLKFLTILFLGIFLILPLVSALDSALVQVCGGDNELIISCLGDEELIFLSGEFPPEVWSGPGGGGVGVDIEEPEVEEPEPEEKFVFPFFSILGLDKIEYDDPEFWGLMLVLFIFFILLILFIRRRVKKKLIKELKKEKV